MRVKTCIGLFLAAALALLLVPTAALAEGALTVTGGTEGTDYSYTNDGKRVMVLTGKPLTISGRPGAASVVVAEGVEANLTLDNATINTPAGAAIHVFSGAKLNLTVVGNNTLTGTADYAGIDVSVGETLVITKESTGTLNVTGGKDGAAIGGDKGQSGGTIIIRGGTVKATSHNSGAGAGIGGGFIGNGGTIRIEGGTVEAKGGWWGAGIGGGGWADGGDIIISGGMVNAMGEAGGAGIGGGLIGAGGNITISGGRVNAVSNWDGAGIGGGWNGSGAELRLTGGVVFAGSTEGPMDVGTGSVYTDPDFPGITPTEGSVEISLDAALFLKHGTCPIPETATHTKAYVTGHAANSAAYGIPVPWSGNFSAYLRLCRLSYDLNGGSGILPEAAEQHIGTTAFIAEGSTLSRTGYNAFSVWNTAANGGGTDFAEGETFTFPENDVTLFAKWTPYTYTVYYNANGGEGATEASSHTYDAPKELPPNGFTRAGYRFTGWAVNSEGPVIYGDGQRVLNLTAEDNGTITLYAQWAVPIVPAPKGTIVNCRNGVNVRSGPGTNYPILGSAPLGAAYTIIEKVGMWYKVEFGTQAGYISSRYFEVSASEIGQGMVVNCRYSVNVRSGPGKRYSILGFAPRGAVYTIIKKYGSWYQIEFNGRTAYISSDYFSAGNG